MVMKKSRRNTGTSFKATKELQPEAGRQKKNSQRQERHRSQKVEARKKARE